MFVVIFGLIVSSASFIHTQVDNSSMVISQDATTVTVRIPKCCPEGLALGHRPTGCTANDIMYVTKFPVHDHNNTRLDDEPMPSQQVVFELYHRNTCTGSKFPMGDGEVPRFLKNGSLIIRGIPGYDGFKTHDEFCVDLIVDKDTLNNNHVRVLVCVREPALEVAYPNWTFVVYIILVILSMTMFGGAAIFIKVQGITRVHKKCFMIFSAFMSLTYLMVFLMQFVNGCKTLGLLFQFSLVGSFTWMSVICFDVSYIVHKRLDNEYLQRFLYYIAGTLTYSFLSVIISSFNHFIPDIPNSFYKTQFGGTTCYFKENEHHTIVFYITLGIPTVICYGSLIYIFIATQMSRTKFRLDIPLKLKMYRLMYFLIFHVMILSWLSCFIAGIYDVLLLEYIQPLQGLLTAIVIGAVLKIISRMKIIEEEPMMMKQITNQN